MAFRPISTAGAEATFTLDNAIRAEAMSVVAYLDVDGSAGTDPPAATRWRSMAPIFPRSSWRTSLRRWRWS